MLKIYTDGSSRKNPGPGGFGVVVLNGKTIEHHHGELYDEDVTNNQMELKALIHAMKYATHNPEEEFVIYSDSAYCVNMCNNWIWGWSKNGWQNSKKQQVENYELVKQIWKYVSMEFPNFRIEKVAGHCGIAGNELADALATGNDEKFQKIRKENDIHYLIEIPLEN